MKTATPPECALAYALWDAENSVKMCKPADIQEHIDRAREIKKWLSLHGYLLRKKKR
jgi:hypothetical protein